MRIEDIHLLAENGTEATILMAVRDHSPLSRARLFQLSGLPPATISRAAAKLLEQGVLVEERNADTSGIRAKRGLGLNPAAATAIGIEYTPRGVSGVVVSAAYGERHRESQELDLAAMGSKAGIAAILKFAKTFVAAATPETGRLLGIGLADPGIVDASKGVETRSTILPGWSGVPVADTISKAFNLPVVLMNSMSAAIRAVDRREVPDRQSNVLFIEYGDGVACGMKLGGRYHGGFGSRAGELGHFRISDRPVPCRCGAAGCLEALASLPSLAREAKSALLDDSASVLASQGDFDGQAVLAAAAAGDRLAGRVVGEAFKYLARAVAGLANVLAPELIILDSSLAQAGERAFDSFEREFELSLLEAGAAGKIMLSKIGPERNALGAAFSILDAALGENHFRQKLVN
jgi:predicted NBD/HSP70 family sugar kinase